MVKIDFTKILNINNIIEEESDFLEFLFNKDMIEIDVQTRTFKDKNGKVLLTVDDSGNIIMSNNVSTSDNIVYTLTKEDMEELHNNFAKIVPNEVEVIFAKENANNLYNLTFDANGVKFKNGKNTMVIDDIIDFNYDNFIKPTRDGYKFVGFYTEKNGGKSYFDLMNSETGIEKDIILYARWEENKTSVIENPDTSDNIMDSIVIGTILLLGIVSIVLYLKRKENLS